ncbi:MAG: hypothetical protein ACYCW6_00745 [Candidatus Xenobia bacterium]
MDAHDGSSGRNGFDEDFRQQQTRWQNMVSLTRRFPGLRQNPFLPICPPQLHKRDGLCRYCGQDDTQKA